MGKTQYAQQAKLIKSICESAGLTWEEMADLAALQRESMRKIASGYQKASDQLIQSFRNIARMREREFMSKELARLLHKLKPADLKDLELDPEELRRYAQGEETPAPALVKILKLRAGETSGLPSVMAGDPPALYNVREAGVGLEEWESSLLLELRRFSEKDRKEIARHMRGILGMIPPKPTKYRPANGE